MLGCLYTPSPVSRISPIRFNDDVELSTCGRVYGPYTRINPVAPTGGRCILIGAHMSDP
ncbi:hypothetical protein SPHINGOR109_10955 [Sphingorhabdus sp. 109]|nr:hypothetical protein SPHINGOR109_10955 [Sphingorhabdus sp. 109]